MREASVELAKQIGQTKGAHVFYSYNQLESYIENAVSFIVQGLAQGERVLFVENRRISPMVFKELQNSLSEKEMEGIHFINNFDFYWRNGNFHPPTILAHFKKATDVFVENDLAFRTWGHIEWGHEQDILNEIELYEKNVGSEVEGRNAISVCAYNASHVSDDLRRRLIACHGYLMTDDSITSLTAK